MHREHSTEFFHLSRVGDYSEGRGLKIEPRKIKGAPFFMEASAFMISKKITNFSPPPESFFHSTRVLMHGYALASMLDPRRKEWCGLEAALVQISTVGNLSRANSKSAGNMRPRIVEAEGAVRSEWAKLGQSQPQISLSAIIDAISQRHAIWPLLSEFTRSQTPRWRCEKGWQGKNGQDKGYGTL